MIGLLLLSGANHGDGMYQYRDAWVDELERENISHINLNSPKQLNKLQIKPFNSNINTVGYQKYPLYMLINIVNIYSELKTLTLNYSNIGVTDIWILDDFVFSSYFIFPLRLFFKGNIRVTLHDPVTHPGAYKTIFSAIVAKINRSCLFIFALFKQITLHVHAQNLTSGTPWRVIKNIEYRRHPIPNATNTRTRCFNSDGRLRLLFIGRIEPYKGLDDFLPAYLRYCENNPKIAKILDLYIVGRGSINPHVLSKLSKATNVIVDNKYVEIEAFHQYIADSDCAVFPYSSATASGVAAIAASYGIPMLVTDVGDLITVSSAVDGSYCLNSISDTEISNGIQHVMSTNLRKNR